jgi:hypothetical protein
MAEVKVIVVKMKMRAAEGTGKFGGQGCFA